MRQIFAWIALCVATLDDVPLALDEFHYAFFESFSRVRPSLVRDRRQDIYKKIKVAEQWVQRDWRCRDR
jgi:hypothetical protein